MATSYSLRTVYKDEAGNDITASYNHADPELSSATVRTFMDTVITNSTAFTTKPSTKYSAELITRTTTEFDIEE